jgi:hypothetical protein
VSNADRVRAAAEAARRQLVDDPLALRAPLADPLPVLTPAGNLDSWFVALTAEDRIVGFFQLEPDLQVHRYSSFQSTRGSVDGCPPAAAWLDRAEIGERARASAGGDQELGEPILSYDGSRDRLAWRVPVLGGPGAVFVAGEHAYLKGS